MLGSSVDQGGGAASTHLLRGRSWSPQTSRAREITWPQVETSHNVLLDQPPIDHLTHLHREEARVVHVG